MVLALGKHFYRNS